MAPTIGIDVKPYALPKGGIYHATQPWVNSLILTHPEWSYRFVGPAQGIAEFEAPNQSEQKIEFPFSHPYAAYAYNCISFPRQFQPDWLDLFYTPYYDLLLPKGIASVITVHDLLYFRLPHLYKWSLIQYYQFIGKRNAKDARAIITDSLQSKEDILQILKVPEKKVHVVYPSLPSFWQEPAIAVEENLFLHQPGTYSLLYTGGLDARKNLARLVHVIQALGETFQLVVTGDRAPYVKAVPEFLSLEQTKQVCWTGFLGRLRLKQLYENCSAVVYPSLWEGFGLPLLEARATGTPVACSNTSSLPEVGGQRPFYFDPTQIAQMKESVEAAAKAPRYQPEFPERFLEQPNHRSYVEVIKKALS